MSDYGMAAFESRDGADGDFRAHVSRFAFEVPIARSIRFIARGAKRCRTAQIVCRQIACRYPVNLDGLSLDLRRGVPLGFFCRPVSGASRGTRVAAPGTASGVLRKLAGAGGIFVLDGDGCVYQPASCDLTSEFHEVWGAYNTIRDVDAEIVSWFASALLRSKGQAPRSIVVRCRRRGGRRQQNSCSYANQGKVFHAESSHSGS